MCKYLESEHVWPGLDCCTCQTYNGLQRDKCRACGVVFCSDAIPADVKRCEECGAGSRKDGMLPEMNLAGKKSKQNYCQICSHPIPLTIIPL